MRSTHPTGWRLYANVTMLAAILVMVLSGVASAGNGETGANFHNNDGFNGSRATLQGDANMGGTNTSVLASVRVQEDAIYGTGGMYQAGWVKAGSNFSSQDCGSGPYNGAIAERVNSTSGAYHCNLYTGIGNYGDTYRFSIKHVSAGWETVKENGNLLDGPFDLNFAHGYTMVASEKFNTIDSMTMTFGPSGGTSWQRYDSSGNTWYQVNTSQKINTDGNWHIGDPPSPFTIGRG